MARVFLFLLLGCFVIGAAAGCGDDDPPGITKKEGKFMERAPGGKAGDGKGSEPPLR